MRSKPELLAPAGDFERMQIAIAYGADAVYLSGTSFGLRANAKNFTSDELKTAIGYAHQHDVRVYVTANIFAHNQDIDQMTGYFRSLADMGADAFIISDPGVFTLAKKEAPDIEIHISTQANTTNYSSAKFWHSLGASRIIMARELSVDEISEISKKSDIALECFVHGAMCMSYSGRCMLSRYMSAGRSGAARDANLGACAHPCRYNYRLYAEEVSRPGHFMPIEENERGTDIFGAEDLCMVEHIPDLINAGVTSFKIEGRMKTAFYVGLTTLAYRRAIDSEDSQGLRGDFLDILKMASHRPFSTGFYFGKPDTPFAEAAYTRSHDFVGIVRGYSDGVAVIEQRNVFEAGDTLTIVNPDGTIHSQKITEMYIQPVRDSDRLKITRAPHAQQMVEVEISEPAQELALVCRKA